MVGLSGSTFPSVPNPCRSFPMHCFNMSRPGVCHHKWTCRVVVTTVIILVFIAFALGVTMVILRTEKSSMVEVDKGQTEEESQMRHHRTQSVQHDPHDKLYLIAIGDNFGGIEARGEEGELIGLARLLIPLVCNEAGINCDMVYSTYDECWSITEDNIRPSGGKALLGRWVDSCFGWFVTLQRIAVYSFGKSILQREKAFFFHKRGVKFDPQNIIGKRIGFIRAWAMNADCIRSKKNIAGADIANENIFHFQTNEEGIDAVATGKIDALFAAWNGVQKLLKQRGIVHASNYVINCLLEGSAVMSRKDSHFPAHWNIGFQKARSSGKFHKLCHSARIQFLHLGSFSCIDEDVI